MPIPSRRRRIWGEVWRELLALSCGLLLWLAVVGPKQTRGYLPGDLWPYADLAIGAASLVVLPLRRRYPMAVATALALATGVSASSVGAASIALISLCTHRRLRQIVPVTLLWVLGGVIFSLMHPSLISDAVPDRITNAVMTAVSTAACVAIGLFIGARRELIRTLHERVATAEREQGLRVTQARVGERARIAREMHDVLAHRISLVAMHSGALTYRSDLSAQEVQRAAAVIQDNAHQALTELREVLGVLRDNGPRERAPEAPQPLLTDLPELIGATRRAGCEVELDTAIALETVPESISRHTYRIVQESLTNARKHAPGQVVRVGLSQADDRLVVQVRNASGPQPGTTTRTPPPSGLGLIGLTERAVLSGGELHYGISRNQEFVVTARLPWPRDED